jgi:aromatic-L-amino-acid decarboxylase
VTELEPDGDEMRRMVEAAMQRIVPHLEAIARAPAHVTAGGPDLARSLREEMPTNGTSLDELLELVFDRALSVTYNTASPGYLAYIPGGGVFPSAVADLIASAINRYVGVGVAAPGLVQLESNVIRWFCQLAGMPASAGGFLTTGGSLANLSAVVSARREKLGDDFTTGVLYGSSQLHNSIAKAARLAGFRDDQVRSLPTDDSFRLRADAVRAAVREDRAAGKTPFLLVANAGATNTGAVDDLEALADVAADEGLWLHVDAAYGGFFLLTERGRAALVGIERADSITLDPHKGLFLPLGTGCLLVRDQEALRRAHGADAFARALDEKLDLARRAADELRELPGVQIVAEPQLSLLAFRHEVEDEPIADRNERNRRLLAAVNAKRRVFLTGTVVDGSDFVLRVCVLHFRTHADRIDMLLEDVRAALDEVGAG